MARRRDAALAGSERTDTCRLRRPPHGLVLRPQSKGSIMFHRSFMGGAAALFVAALPVSAQESGQRSAPPAPFQRAIQCRSVTDPQERLACYDREVAALAAAEQQN